MASRGLGRGRRRPWTYCFVKIPPLGRPICRPDQHQRQVYNGHKRVHALKFQSVTLPNGIIANLYGPVGKMWFMCILYFNIMIVYVVYNVAWLFAVQAVSRCYYSGKLWALAFRMLLRLRVFLSNNIDTACTAKKQYNFTNIKLQFLSLCNICLPNKHS